jgi:hypothetical protein
VRFVVFGPGCVISISKLMPGRILPSRESWPHGKKGRMAAFYPLGGEAAKVKRGKALMPSAGVSLDA